MSATTQQDTWSLDEDDHVEVSLHDVRKQDAYWQKAHAKEGYFRAGLSYDDYAPAYCVGYTGQMQYGGSWDDAEKSLISNWVRIKGDSRLSLEDALLAMRAAWDRLAQPQTARKAVPARRRAAQPRRNPWGRLLEGAAAFKRDLDRSLARPRGPQGGLVRR
ncbi:MAG: hypothetical protein V4864_21530 [Pseudomonadota bacterium]